MQIMCFFILKNTVNPFSFAATDKQTGRTLAAQRVVLAQSVITLLAVVAALSFDVGFAATLASDHPHVQVGVTVTHPPFLGSDRIAVTGWRSWVAGS